MQDDHDVGELMVSAYTEGSLSEGSMDALTRVSAIGDRIAEGLGSDLSASLLVSIMPDDSASIATSEMREAVCAGHNLVMDAFFAKDRADDVLVHTRYLNGRVLNPYCRPLTAKRMAATKFATGGMTPLYDQAVVLLGTVFAKWRQLTPTYGAPRTVTVLITDGDDTDSHAASPRSVRWIVEDMLLAGDHIIAGMGIDDGETDFRQVFADMGIPKQWILTPDSSSEDIARNFKKVAKAVELAAVASEDDFRLLAAGPPDD